MINVLFSARSEQWPSYEPLLNAAFERNDLTVHLSQNIAPEEVDYIVYSPSSGLSDFTPFTKTKAVLSLWAGVEQIVENQTLTQPLTRMVDIGLEQGMIEWVTGHILRHHLGMDTHIKHQDGIWRADAPPLASDRQVSILGLGALGQSCAKALAGLGFSVTGWSRTPRQIDGISCVAGPEGLKDALTSASIVVLLLPATSATENILNEKSLSYLPKGAYILNPGRGDLIDDAALLDAIDQGQIGHATLDVFRQEPLPPDHPYWKNPKVTVTPHIASETRPATASEVVAENIRRSEAGEPLLYLVDRGLGY